MIKSIMNSNIYEPSGTVLIVGSCLPQMQPNGFAQLAAKADAVYALCLEETHINMAVTKIAAALSTGKISKLMFASVDRSPHCTQMHYIKHEILRMMPLSLPIEDYVVVDEQPIFISDETIELSKTLCKLATMNK